MFVPLPELDDRRFRDLVDEGRALIPTYAPSWTDHNAHDPGITVMESLAWIAETAIYSVNRIPERHRLAFLSMVGVEPSPAIPAQAVAQFGLKVGALPVELPSGTELGCTLLDGSSGLFQLRGEISVQPVSLVVVQVESGGRFIDLSSTSARGKRFAPFGEDPAPGDALYLGFDAPIAPGQALRLEIDFAGERAGLEPRARIEREAVESLLARAPRLASGQHGAAASSSAARARQLAPQLPAGALTHHSAVVVWEAQVAPGEWQPIEARDDTRSASLSGSVVLRMPQPTRFAPAGVVERALHYVRCRLASGAFDAAPRAEFVRANAARVLQVTRAFDIWTIARGVVAIGTPPPAGAVAWLSLEIRGDQVTALEFAEPGPETLRARVLSFNPATDARAGQLALEAVRVGVGDGAPHQRYRVPGPFVSAESFELYSIEEGSVARWQRQASLRSLGPADRGFLLEVADSAASFGDGQSGRVPPPGAYLIAVAERTAGEAGNVPAGAIAKLALTPRNQAFLQDAAEIGQRIERITNVVAASGGEAPENLAHAEGRALESVHRTRRAITLPDCEQLALETPGTAIARAAARAHVLPGLDCHTALGFITLVIIPFLPAARPQPSPGLLGAVSRYLNRRRVLGTRIVVTGPEYLEVAVHAEVRAYRGENRSTLRAAVESALRAFLDPLGGGPDAAGWPLGRDVYVSEVLDIISRVPGVDHVSALQIVVPGCDAQCGDVCVRPLALVTSGTHQIVVS
jgi:predicted phage baseplate assembly protein